jgi:hypothetical protein
MPLNEGVFPCGYRIGFIPLFMICNVLPEGRVLTSVLLESDIAYILIMAAFSLTNGYLGSLCMINAPQVIFSSCELGFQCCGSGIRDPVPF